MPLVRQNPERVQRLVAGDSGHGGAVQWYRWVRNSATDLKQVTSTAMAAQIAGEPEKTESCHFGRKREMIQTRCFVLRSGCLGLKGLNGQYLEAEEVLEVKEKLRW